LERNQGGVSEELSLRFAAEAFERTACYDATIGRFLGSQLSRQSPFPPRLALPLSAGTALRYGENPHQLAALYIHGHETGIPQGTQLQGVELSYNNYLDLDAGFRLCLEFEGLCCVIIKHMNPAGVGVAGDAATAFDKALAGDPLSAFGGVIAVRGVVDEALATRITSSFFEAVVAAGYAEGALKKLGKKKRLRVLEVPAAAFEQQGSLLEGKFVLGGVVLQRSALALQGSEQWETKTSREPTPDEKRALLFNWKVVAHTKSNAIVIGREDMIVGVGSGQSSRVDSVKQSIQKARERGHDVAGCVLASDAFFPFRDSVDAAAEAGIKAIVQPGGSIRDNESIDAADEHGIVMVFTDRRCFWH
jgi:phosphoribosylaminoimidazolecarboxamide formyltransferase/IMP cyclohydrolase